MKNARGEPISTFARIAAWAFIGLVTAVPTGVAAQLSRRGNEFQVNTLAEGDQTHPQIAALPDGGFFVVWRSNGDLMARRFSPASQPLGPELKVNETIPDTDPGQRLAVAGDGSVLVAWCAFMPPYSTGIVGRRYDAAGTPEGPPFTILDRGSYWGVAVGATGAHEFVVAWTDLDTRRAHARSVAPTGVGPSFVVAEQGSQYDLAIGSAATGPYQVVWYGEPIATMQGRSFTGEHPSGDTFSISMVSSATHQGPAICSRPAGDFVVTWVTKEEGPSGGTQPVRYREYTAQSVPLSAAAAVTPDEIDQDLGHPFQVAPVVACGVGTEFTVVWLESENPTFSIRGERFVEQTATSIFRIGLGPRPSSVSVARLVDGDDVVTWSECSTSTGCEVFAQRFTSDAPEHVAGDCDGDGHVAIGELVTIVDAILSGDAPAMVKGCLAADSNLDYVLTVDELITAVDRSLGR